MFRLSELKNCRADFARYVGHSPAYKNFGNNK